MLGSFTTVRSMGRIWLGRRIARLSHFTGGESISARIGRSIRLERLLPFGTVTMMFPPGLVILASSFRWLTGSGRYSRTPMLSTRSREASAASIESPSATLNSCVGNRRRHSAIIFSEMSIPR